MSYPPPPPGYQQPMYPMTPPNHSKATLSLVLGIISLVACGFLTGIPAMIIGRGARREIAASNGQLGGDGLANAGFITGLIGTILSALGFLALILLFALGAFIAEGFDENCTTLNSEGVFVSC